jgi:hypothetical protein
MIIGFNDAGWLITNEISNDSGRWELMDKPEVWPWDFCPIQHWQNMPQPGDVYGSSDIEDVLELQDRYNFVMSNINRIVRFHAHPKTIVKGAQPGQMQQDASTNSVWYFGDPNTTVDNLEMQSDLASSREFAADLKNNIFDTTRTVDMSVLKDKVGNLTNFGLRTLYKDALDKLKTKQELFGEALTEINHRLLVLAEITPDDGGVCVFEDPLPSNEMELTQALQFDLTNGLVSKETAAIERGYDWEQERERIEGERASEDNIGSALLRAFDRGGGGGGFGNNNQGELR